jgi:RHS repeat-associated protein
VGNRTTAQATTYSYDAANQLETSTLAGSRTTYTYDANGNLRTSETVNGGVITYTWDDENRLTQIEEEFATTNQYTFNGDGQRVQIVDSQGTKKPIWDFENILLETDGSNVTQVVYTLEPVLYGNLVSQRRGSTTSFYLFDALGSTRKLTSSAGAVTDSYEFKAYGETFASSGTTVNVFRWVGELGYYYDIDRLAYYLRARPYNPALARFLSQDPIGFVGSKWNLYEYADGSPTSLVDPNGLVCTYTPVPTPAAIVAKCKARCAKKGEAFDKTITTRVDCTLLCFSWGYQITECLCKPKPRKCAPCPKTIRHTNPIGPPPDQNPEVCNLIRETPTAPCLCYYRCPSRPGEMIKLPGTPL